MSGKYEKDEILKVSDYMM